MNADVHFRVHAALEDVQRREPWHRKIGSKDKEGHHIPIDGICRECPSRRPCWKISIALADLHSGRCTDDQALAVVAALK